MNNGEGTREEVSEVASPESYGGDVSPASLSHYSSCGESEFERYCSANSVMGTPSVRSSFGNDCVDSEFGSLKSLGFGDDLSFENFSLGGNRKLSILGDRRIEFRERRNDKDSKIESGVSGLHCDGDININSSNEGRINHHVDMQKNGSEIMSEGGERSLVGSVVGNSRGIELRAEEGSFFGLYNEEKGHCSDGFDGNGMEGEKDGTSSRYEHSEGEDSMYNCGSDEEHRGKLYYPTNVGHVQEAKGENENPLVINSHVAFGSNDWDDFEQEVGGSTLSSLTLEKVHERREPIIESQKNLLSFTSKSPIGFLSGGQKEQGNDATDEHVVSKKIQGVDECEENINHSTATPAGAPSSAEQENLEEEKDISIASYQIQGRDLLTENINNLPLTAIGLPRFSHSHQDVRDIFVTCNQFKGTDLSEESTKIPSPTPSNLPKFYGPDQYVRDVAASTQVQGDYDLKMHHKNGSASDFFEAEHEPPVEMAPLKIGLDIVDSGMERKHQNLNKKEVSTNDCGIFDNQEFGYFTAALADVSVDQLCSDSIGFPGKLSVEFFEDRESKLCPSTYGNITNASKNSPSSADLFKEHPAKSGNLELNDFYDEVVHEMEEILLDYSESPMERLSQVNQMSQSQLSLPRRDGGSTASTSGTDDAYPLTLLPLRIDGVEVIGAKQKKGDVSLSERLVGVKEYTVYKIRVWSGKDQWVVERRYRDFYTLYRRLKSLFAEEGWSLPSPWSSVEKESRKIFGNASPLVVAHRSVLIQECLQSVLHSSSFSSPPNALITFLSQQESLPSSPASNTLVCWSTSFTKGTDAENMSTLGKTISLIVEIKPHRSMKQMLESQHYTCAGCHKHFDDGITLMRDFVQTLGWGKPRLCEYAGQLFCSTCHTNETAVLPARVLHHWDFTRYPVSQLAKSFLDSVYNQPMLCVSAVNPLLYSKVPALQHVMGVRKKIGSMLPYVHCPFRRSINKGLGSRRYLLESNDFFALRDLIDLSKGPFAALPAMVETVSKKILVHITEQCLICCDVGVPCCARQACDDPSSLIFAFQEGEVERCKSCEAVFHKPCFKKLTCCSCGASLGVETAVNSIIRASHNANAEANGPLNLLGNRAATGLSIGLLSGLFSKPKPDRTENRDSNNVILMGSLPSTSI